MRHLQDSMARRGTFAIAALFAAALLLAPAAEATTQTGQLEVFVSGPDGLPAKGVQLELSGPNLLGTRKEVTDEDGSGRFRELAPGTYSVKSSLDLYRTMTTEGINVDIGRTASIDVVLEKAVATEAEAFVVKGTVPMIDTESTTRGAVVSNEFANTVPTSRDYQGVALLAAGVNDSTGGGNPEVMGSTLYGNQYLLDGVNVTDPVTNTFSANYNFDAIQSVELLTGARDAEYGSAVGGVINVVTKRGGNEHTADFSLYYKPAWLQIMQEGEQRLDNQSFEANAAFGGPIKKDELWYFASLSVPYSASALPATSGNTGIFPDQKDANGNPLPHPSRTFFGVYGLGKLTWQPTPTRTFSLLFQSDPTLIQNTEQSATTHPAAESKQYQSGFRVSLGSEIFLTPKLFWNTRLAYSSNGLQIGPESGDTETPGRTNSSGGTATVNYNRLLDDERHRVQFHSSLARTLENWFGDHQFKTGVDASFTWNDVLDTIPGGRYFIDNGLDPSNPNSASGAGLPYREVRLVEAQDSTIYGDTEGLFVQDVWKVTPRITLRPGLRFDSARMRNWEGIAQVQINTFSPRFGVAWDPWGDKKTVFRAGYYQYVDTGYLSLSDFAGGRGKLTRTYEYDPVTGKYDKFFAEEGGASGAVGKDYLKDPWNQQRPRTHEFVLGGSRELMTDLSVSLDFTYRYSANQWEDTESNAIWNADGTQVIGFRNGDPRYIYSLGALPEAFIRYYDMELQLQKRFSNNWEMMASYTYGVTEGTEPSIISVAFDRPAQRPYEFGYLPHDRRHALKVYSSYRFGNGVTFGGSATYLSGFPYNRGYFNDYYSDYNDRRAPRGFDVDENGKLVPLRLPDRFTMNARVQWDLEQLTGKHLDLILDVFNVLNSRTPTAVEERNLPAGGGAQFGDVTDRQSPFSAQIGVRYRM